MMAKVSCDSVLKILYFLQYSLLYYHPCHEFPIPESCPKQNMTLIHSWSKFQQHFLVCGKMKLLLLILKFLQCLKHSSLIYLEKLYFQ